MKGKIMKSTFIKSLTILLEVMLTVGLTACGVNNSGIDDVKHTTPVEDEEAESDISNNGNQTALLPDFNIALGNVPTEYIPNSEITFDSEGTFTVTDLAKSVTAPKSATSSTGNEVGGNLADLDPKAQEIRNAESQRLLESLPVYTYEDYYIAAEGAVAQYDQDGQLICVLGDYEYYSTLDQYKINGILPDGTYKGTFGQFSISTTRALKIIKGKFTTYGNKWPAIPTSDTASNADPVPTRGTTLIEHLAYYGDRIGTQDNKLKIGDVATRQSDKIPYNTVLTVTVLAADTGSTDITKNMRVRDEMSATVPVLDIWRWDQPEWFTGVAQAPNDLYFNKKYSKNLSFTNTGNYFTYNA